MRRLGLLINRQVQLILELCAAIAADAGELASEAALIWLDFYFIPGTKYLEHLTC